LGELYLDENPGLNFFNVAIFFFSLLIVMNFSVGDRQMSAVFCGSEIVIIIIYFSKHNHLQQGKFTTTIQTDFLRRCTTL